jgi:hypothetical protein
VGTPIAEARFRFRSLQAVIGADWRAEGAQFAAIKE